MKREEANIRDPFVMLYDGTYYLYGTRSATCWGPADGFDVYTSRDLENFEGPFEIFRRPEGFFADEAYWAPECYEKDGAFYLVTTLGAGDRKKGIYVLKADSPKGPFEVWSGRLTPENWTCIDGTVYFENGTPWLVYSHSLEDPEAADGDFCAQKLAPDLKSAEGAPAVLLCAKDAPWSTPVPFARQEFGIEKDAWFSDGPFLWKCADGGLCMILSSWSRGGYAVGLAKSVSGRLKGPWKHLEKPLFPENGGHGMLFKDKEGQILFVLHYPNDKFKEHPVFFRVTEENGALRLGEQV